MPEGVLTEDRRKQLDDIVSQMEANGEPEDNVRLVVGDFKQKYSAAQVPQPQAGAVSRFASGLGEQINPINMMRGIAQASANPVATAKEIGYGGAARTFDKAKDAFKRGDYIESVRHGINYMIPVIGPQLDELGDQAQRGDVAGAAGGTVGLGLTAVAPNVFRTVPAIRGFKTAWNPGEAAAVKSLEPTVELSAGQKTGSPFLRQVEQKLPSMPGSSGTAQDFFNSQQQQLRTKAGQVSAQVSPVQTDAVGAGQAMSGRLQDRIVKLKSQADNLYGQIRKATGANQVTQQVGQKSSGVLDPSGNMIQSPVMKTFDTPVDIGTMKASLQPIYDDLSASMDTIRKQYSPAYKALSDVMNSPEPFMNAMEFDKFLGAVKSLTRDGASPYLTTKSQALAKQVIRSGEGELQAALKTAGPDVNSKLGSARRIVRAYYDTDELLRDMERARGGEPAAVYNNLVLGGDRAFDSLTELRKIAPKELQTVGRTFLEGMFQKASAEGGFNKAATIFNEWNRMGPRTKEMLFGPATADIDKFMLGAKKVTDNLNPSGTSAGLAALAGSVGIGAEALTALFTGHPGLAIAGPSTALASRGVAAALLSRGGSKAVTQGLRVPMVGPARVAGMSNVVVPRSHGDPLSGLDDEQRAIVEQQIESGQDGRITDATGHVMMWRKQPDGRIQRLR